MKNEPDYKDSTIEVFFYIKTKLLSISERSKNETSAINKFAIQASEIKEIYERLLKSDVFIQEKEMLKISLNNIEEVIIQNFDNVEEILVSNYDRVLEIEKNNESMPKLNTEINFELNKLYLTKNFTSFFYEQKKEFHPKTLKENNLLKIKILNNLHEKGELSLKIEDAFDDIKEYLNNCFISKEDFKSSVSNINYLMKLVISIISGEIIENIYKPHEKDIVSTEHIYAEDVCNFFEYENVIGMLEAPQIKDDLSNL